MVYDTDGALGNLSWHVALDFCQNRFGTSLASIHDSTQNNELILAINNAGITGVAQIVWIGLNDIDNENVFVFSDGTPFDFTSELISDNWNGNEHCVEVRATDGLWRDLACDGTPFVPVGFVCNNPCMLPILYIILLSYYLTI